MTPRGECLGRLRERGVWDLVVIGGGATGLGTAVDAAARGYRTLLLEADDFTKGTSSRSTKLIHGGVRYLASGQVGLVREALRERGRLLRNAPHVVHDLAFLVPAYAWWERPYYGLGLWLYDRLAGAANLGRSRAVGRDDAETIAPTLRREGLRGGVVYHDGQFDDARLAIALARTFDDLGGTALNAVAVVGLLKDAAGAVRGVRARDAETGEVWELAARGVVNATGVFTDDVRRLDEPEARPLVTVSQGAHIVLDQEFFPGDSAVLIPKTDDGRVLFMIPWHGRVIVGTTDTPIGAPTAEPRPLPQELEFLMAHAGRYLTRAPGPGDVRSLFAGLRPLVAPGGGGKERTSALSREHTVLVSRSGLVTITGGKWTTYRAMGEEAVDLAAKVAGLPARACPTAELRLHGAGPERPSGPFAAYGSDAPALQRLAAERPELAEAIHPRLPYAAVEVVWAARNEAARSVEDVLARRTRSLFLDARASAEAAPRVAALLAAELGRDDRWAGLQASAFRDLASRYLLPG
jgi:glycerol-3-phosphate dehydrogenase